jgi:transcriptional regulator with XRE-family HTH domain
MPKSVDVEDFSVKLALIAKRLNWSRAKLAQQVGVDKSLAARWLNGNSRPTGNSLMQLTAAVAQAIDDFTAADWDLSPEQFSRRLGIEAAASPASGPAAPALLLTGLRNPPPAATWGTAYVGLWGGFYQSLTNRGMIRLCVCEFVIGAGGLRFTFSDGVFVCEGPALAAHTHVHAICEIAPLDNHLLFLTFNAAQDLHGAAVIDGVQCLLGADHTPSAGPILLFRIDEPADRETTQLRALMPRVTEVNEQVESEAARTGDVFSALLPIASLEILRTLCLVVGTPRPDGQIDHVMRIPPRRSLATGRLALSNLPGGSPLRMVPVNLRRVLGLDTSEKIRLVHYSKR